ncbi:alanyl-tRNA editing protein [Thermoplasma sp. Kam2015]|uniref:alanyl-tRNA editing protein AlaXM n=1 Tax=Thermoplasma sp. Kam2015 TaxID=2094122 RepID=UPI000D8FAF02|nr:alanyl-tRNA editing protein AlaXM [Thermoplasma sp. Kam2015]PYB69101.1 alanyl-tRNA editing protein [Thermoplasma sp. Kam2015]
MTEKIYYDNMYLKEFDAEIVSVDSNRLILNRTAFYPTGGGQPNDVGVILKGDARYRVIDVQKQGDDVIHILENADGLQPGDSIHGIIDWQRRYAHMRYHTAIHILDGIVSAKHNSEALLTGGQIYEDRSRIDMNIENFTKEFVDQIIEEANEFIAEGHRVYAENISREEALKRPNLARTEPGRKLIESLPVVRIIVIEGLDEQSDGGTHVANTKEVGRIILRKIENKGRKNKRIEFELSPA